MQQRHAAFTILSLLFAALFLAGCSGIDDLRVVNNYPFEVRLRSKSGELLGDVPAYNEHTFHGAGGYNGDGVDGISVENARHKPLETLSYVEKQDERINGSVTWNVTLGPPAPAPSPVYDKPFSVGWVFAGVSAFHRLD